MQGKGYWITSWLNWNTTKWNEFPKNKGKGCFNIQFKVKVKVKVKVKAEFKVKIKQTVDGHLDEVHENKLAEDSGDPQQSQTVANIQNLKDLWLLSLAT